MKRLPIMLVPLVLAACEAQPPAPGAREEVVVAAPAHHFTVDSSAYTLRRDGEGWTTSIGYVFRNPTGDTIGIVNCNGAIVMDLQKHMGDDWQRVWYGMSNGCLSPPIVVPPRDSITGRIDVWGAEQGHPNYPTFETDTIDGEYRLIWHHMRTGYDAELPNFGDTLSVEQKTSTTFQVARPAVRP